MVLAPLDGGAKQPHKPTLSSVATRYDKSTAMVSREVCPRDAWRDATKRSDLPPTVRHVALIFAGISNREGLGVWVTHDRLMRETGRTTNTVTAARRGLIDGGWLVETEHATGRRAARYALTVPTVWASASETQDPVDKSGKSGIEPRSLRLNRESLTLSDESLTLNHESLTLNQRGRDQETNRDQPPYPPSSPREVSNGEGRHPHEPNARRALTTLVAECHLPLDHEVVLALAYEVGNGDPWPGYLAIKQAAVQSFDGARDVLAVLRKRLGLHQARAGMQ